MEAFKLDVSGFVIDPRKAGSKHQHVTRWSDLSPFAHGYVEALFAGAFDLEVRHVGSPETGYYRERGPAFSDLSPEALARIIADCAACCSTNPCIALDQELGAEFWRNRQSGNEDAFPPLTPTLSDDGLIYFREQA